MLSNSNIIKTLTLSEQVRRSIYSRVAISFFISLFVALLFLVLFIVQSLKHEKMNIQVKAQELTPYIISQELIGNRYAIDLKLHEFNGKYNVKISWFENETSDKSGFNHDGFFGWKYYVPVQSVDGENYGYYVILGNVLNNQDIVNGILLQILLLLVFLFIILIVLYPVAKNIPNKIFIKPINDLVDILHNKERREIDNIDAAKEIKQIMREVIAVLDTQAEMSKRECLLQVAQNVAHDIRSPLAAINTAVSTVSDIPEESRVMIKHAAIRINDIANNLLSKYKNYDLDLVNGSDLVIDAENIFIVLCALTSEKRLEFSEREVLLSLEVEQNAYECFCNIDSATLQRVFSNVINNSYESITEKGNIKINLSCSEDYVCITIEDDGCGIPSELISKVKSKGFTYGKNKTGAGVGLSYSSEHITLLGGVLRIDSKLGNGTIIKIDLPRVAAPEWFCLQLSIKDDETIMVIDDDVCIHNAWSHRLEYSKNTKLIHLYDTSVDCEEAIIKHNPSLFLIDYELLGCKHNGLDFIESMGIQKKSYLVTSYFEDKTIRERCENIGVKIIPKAFVPYVPIVKNEYVQSNQVIFIDDDVLIRETWEFSADRAGEKCITFSSTNAFLSVIRNYSHNSKIYIDSELHEDQRGEDFAKKLYELGFMNIYLATGHSNNPEKFRNCYWIRAVVGKEPPFNCELNKW